MKQVQVQVYWFAHLQCRFLFSNISKLTKIKKGDLIEYTIREKVRSGQRSKSFRVGHYHGEIDEGEENLYIRFTA